MLTFDVKRAATFIKKNREGLRITSSELADMLGVSSAAVSQWEHGSKSIDLQYITLLCDIFEISVDDFVKSVSSEHFDDVRLYDFSRDYFIDGKLNVKSLKSPGKKIEFVSKYCESLAKFKSMIKDLFEDKEVDDNLFRSFTELFGVERNEQKLTKEIVVCAKEEVSYECFMDSLTFRRDMNEMIFRFFDDEIFGKYIDMIGESERNNLLISGIEKDIDDDLIVILVRHGAVIKNENGDTDFEKTLKLIQNK